MALIMEPEASVKQNKGALGLDHLKWNSKQVRT